MAPASGRRLTRRLPAFKLTSEALPMLRVHQRRLPAARRAERPSGLRCLDLRVEAAQGRVLRPLRVNTSPTSSLQVSPPRRSGRGGGMPASPLLRVRPFPFLSVAGPRRGGSLKGSLPPVKGAPGNENPRRAVPDDAVPPPNRRRVRKGAAFGRPPGCETLESRTLRDLDEPGASIAVRRLKG
jgi:hypothetical protein